ncbi:DUF1513 domain-containing protein [Ferrovibrio sp.]|uniref:DUF1513 domain-containing protein n=1 Tax=Ferrovibrio sp. TaxID=1917215 RepID=UPI000CAF300D|nr:DUF1513 domain-containing protein [Ferrovibrio sp.]PJI37824.1 MAG: hypothetical protein CTR53_18665 [Ferrovibrio sp.]
MITRRSALSVLGGASLLPMLGHSAFAAARTRLYVNAYGEKGGFGLAGFDADGQIRYRLPLPGRGHSFARREDGRIAVAFSRRPGDYALVFDPVAGTASHRIPAAEDRNFCGHGAFTADGKLMFATEAVGSTGDGVLGIYDAGDGWRRVGEVPTHGLDPHEVRLMPDDRTLVVANGGILMRSDMPRLKLNIPDMDPSLVYLDARDGSLVRQVRPAAELRQLSIRHIAIDRRGRVAVAMQYEGPAADQVPLVALHDAPAGAGRFDYLPMPEDQRVAMRQYCGSAAMDGSGRYLAVSSPRGNRVLVWDMERLTLARVGEARDVCGIAAQPDAGFMVSNGLGSMYRLGDNGSMATLAEAGELQWDNHMVAAG